MNRGFFKNLVDRGKALIEKAKPSFMRGTNDLADLSDGFVKLPSQADTSKLRETNPYFRITPSTGPELPPLTIVVVGFHHKKGSIIEYTFPEEMQAALSQPPYEDLGKKVCFVAIPDAVHTLEVRFDHVHAIERLRVFRAAPHGHGVVRRDVLPADRVLPPRRPVTKVSFIRAEGTVAVLTH